jgi:hypothetical protein
MPGRGADIRMPPFAVAAARFSRDTVFGELGILSLCAKHAVRPSYRRILVTEGVRRQRFELAI